MQDIKINDKSPHCSKHVLPAVPLSEVYLEDCVTALKRYADNHFDLAIVDPPYGIEIAEWDKERPTDEYWEQLFRVSKNQIVWGGNYFTEYLEPKMGWIVWNKMQRDFSLADGELAWTSFDKAMRIFDMSRGEALAKNNKAGGRFHPTQKPVQLYKWLLNKYAKAGDTILDTHLGSGSSAIAAHDDGFEFTGIELDEEYYNAAKERIMLHQRQLNLF